MIIVIVLSYLIKSIQNKGFICHQMLNNSLFKFSALMKTNDYNY